MRYYLSVTMDLAPIPKMILSRQLLADMTRTVDRSTPSLPVDLEDSSGTPSSKLLQMEKKVKTRKLLLPLPISKKRKESITPMPTQLTVPTSCPSCQPPVPPSSAPSPLGSERERFLLYKCLLLREGEETNSSRAL